MLLVTRKDAAWAGVTDSMWRRARRRGVLKPALKHCVRATRFEADHVAQVFGLPRNWQERVGTEG